MRQSTLMLNMLSAWIMAIVYDRIKVNTGIEIKLLLCASIVLMIVGLYRFCRKSKGTDKSGV